MKLNQTQVADMFNAEVKSVFVSIDTAQPVKCKKGSPAFTKATTYSNVMLLSGYEKAVNNALARQGKEANFEAKPHKWATVYKDSPIVLKHEKKGSLYLNTRFPKNIKAETEYFDENGVQVTYEDVEPYMLSSEKKETKVKAKEAQTKAQGLEVSNVDQDAVKQAITDLETAIGRSLTESEIETIKGMETFSFDGGVFARTIAFDNIKEIRYNGGVIEIV